MKIIPVIDLMGGQVVRGVGGERSSYAPVESCIASDPRPSAVARAFADRFSATDVYVADLDAIRGSEPDWDSLEQIGECGTRVWVDCGIGSARTAEAVQTHSSTRPYLDRLVVGLESIRSISDLPAIGAAIGSKSIFSLDLKQGRPITQVSELGDVSPLEIARTAWDSGFECILVLDLTFVGTGRGVGVVELCRRIRSQLPKVELIAGGGIRSQAEIQLLADAGCNGVLVASALHDGSITRKDFDCFDRSASEL